MPPGYLLISPERNGTEAFQENELIMYVDDVKLLPLSTGFNLIKREAEGLSAFYDPLTGRICVTRLPLNTRMIRLYDITGRVLQEMMVPGDKAMLDVTRQSDRVFIIKAITSSGISESVKVIRNPHSR